MKRWALMSGNVAICVVEQSALPAVPGVWIDVTGLIVGPEYQFNEGNWIAPAI
jgi:hypothetical protein